MLWERKPRFRSAEPSTSSRLDLTIRRGRVIEGPLATVRRVSQMGAGSRKLPPGKSQRMGQLEKPKSINEMVGGVKLVPDQDESGGLSWWSSG